MRAEDLKIDLELLVEGILHVENYSEIVLENVNLVLKNAEIRAEYLSEVPLLTAQEIRGLSSRRSSDKNGPTSRWKREKKIFAVCYDGIDLYPAFQFEDGAPKPIIEKILAILPDCMSTWQIAFWFESGNGWLDGVEPQNCLSQTEEILYAARQIAEPAIG